MLHVLDLRGVEGELVSRLPRPDLGEKGPLDEVRRIISLVRQEGDKALFELTARFDKAEIDGFAVPLETAKAALGRLPAELAGALSAAADRIRAFHEHRPLPEAPFEKDGIAVELRLVPVERAGVYVPGGRAKYPSSVLMTAIPPKVAGVGAVAVCVPPRRDGSLPDEVLAAAHLAGVDEIYRVGGAQAIAALAYGTETIRAVDVIVGAGSRIVSLAKQEVRGVVGVPAAFAGPSEVVVVADATSPRAGVAIDLVVQAEHGPDGLAWLVTWSEEALAEINQLVGEIVSRSSRREEIESTLEKGGYAVLVDGPAQAMEVANAIAPEHLELCCEDPRGLSSQVRHAGAVFIGPYSPASIGDYYAGPSHVLPTFRSARFSSALGVDDFLRRIHVIEASKEGLQKAAGVIEAIATAEGLEAHAHSVRYGRHAGD
jgi:histidinol dehydrogenase